MNIDQLNELLKPHGQKIVFAGIENAHDVKWRPPENEEKLRSLRAQLDALCLLSKMTGSRHITEIKIDSLMPQIEAEQESTERLGELLRFHGSDKSTWHRYYLFYGKFLFGRRNDFCRILEIGIGTNNIDVPSNMGEQGKPGASLRAFRDWAPNAFIFGADIDHRVLFSEDRIKTYHVDQTSFRSLRELQIQFAPYSLDLIIDDGLHTFEANINTLNFALGLVKDDGAIVIEDVSHADYEYWKLVARLLWPSYQMTIISNEPSIMVAITRNLSDHKS